MSRDSTAMPPRSDQPRTCLKENATRDLARFAASLRFEDVPHGVIEKIKLLALDAIGCCIHGATLPWTRRVAELVEGEGGRPVASIFGRGRKTSISQAVLVNSTDRKSTRLNSSHSQQSRMPSSA